MFKICNKCNKNLSIDRFPIHSENKKPRLCCKTCETKRLKTNHKNLSIERKREYAKKASKIYRIKNKLNPEKVPATILRNTKHGDNKKKRKNDLDIEFVKTIIKNGCIHCGETDMFMMTLDRKDNNLGHLKTNVDSVCYRCNMIRRDMPYKAFVFIAPSIKEARKNGLFGNWIGGFKKLINSP